MMIKLLHTVIWVILAGCILTLPVLAVSRRFRWAAVITVVALLEWTVLAINGGRCPLTDIAARYTLDRASNFDIYLPNWLAEHNKLIFGLLFFVGEFVVIGRWIRVTSGISLQAANSGSHGTEAADLDPACP